MRPQIVIPARLASTRLPEKLLMEVHGKSILQHTHDACVSTQIARSSALPHPVIVAVDDPRLAEAVESFGGHAMMTSSDCNSGTDRVAEIARTESAADVFINVQGDEPEIDPHAIDALAAALSDDATADMATIVAPLRNPDDFQDPACVKAILDDEGRAVYFSRAPIPFPRDGITQEALNVEPPICFQHLGLYAYRRDFLAWFTAQPPCQLEQTERLEQLRAVQAGKRIVARQVAHATVGIDTQADFDALVRRLDAK